jgi:hypothetical protein
MIYQNGLRSHTAKHYAGRQIHVGVEGVAILLGIATLVLLTVVFFSLSALLPASGVSPQSQAAVVDRTPRAIAAIQQRLTDEVDDPMIEVANGIFVRESNLHGVVVDGVKYFYAIQGHQSFDPLSRGDVSSARIEIIHQTQGAFPLIIYTIKGEASF